MERAQVRVMFIVKGVGQDGSQIVENTLIKAFQEYGYNVMDAATVSHTLRRDADLLRLYEIETAKRFGSRLGADIVVSGEARSRMVDQSYALLEGKKITVSQAHVSAKAVLARSGRVLMAENAHARQAFDTTGEIALQTAAETLAGKLLRGIEQFLARDTTDYRLVVLNVDHPESLAIQEALQRQLQGIRQVSEHGFAQQTLELDVSVEKGHDLSFKSRVLTGLSGFGRDRFEVVAREGETIYLRKTSATPVPQARPAAPPSRPPSQTRPTPPTPTDAASRQASPEPAPGGRPAVTAKYNPGYRKSWAVVIGIDEYRHWPKLQYAVNDARAVERLLKNLGFDEVIGVFDREATQQRILRILGDELYAKTQDDDRVFLFFAGHGQTQDLPNGSKVGYIIPVDGDLNHYYSTAISMRQLQDLSDRLRAKHMFYAMDACFSGILLRLRSAAPGDSAAMQLTTMPTRQVLTAGAEGEQVVELAGHGLFTKSLLAGLEGAADLNQDGYITASELYQFIGPRVLAESRNSQNPVFGRLGFGLGEFVFVRH